MQSLRTTDALPSFSNRSGHHKETSDRHKVARREPVRTGCDHLDVPSQSESTQYEASGAMVGMNIPKLQEETHSGHQRPLQRHVLPARPGQLC